MATTAAPYGLRPVKRVDGMPYAGATSTYLIDPDGYNTNIFYGSVVYINADGYINIVTATGADATTNAWPMPMPLRASTRAGIKVMGPAAWLDTPTTCTSASAA
jgi:hypothetical protein